MLALIIGWVYFRASSMEEAHMVLGSMFGFNGISLPGGLERVLSSQQGLIDLFGLKFNGLTSITGTNAKDMLLWIVPLCLIALFTPNSMQILEKIEEEKTENKYKLAYRFAPICVAVMMAAAISTLMSVSEFLYFNF